MWEVWSSGGDDGLILYIICNFTGPRDVWIADGTLFLVPVRVFLKEVSVWFGRLREKNPSSSMWVGFIQYVGGQDGTKRWSKGRFTLCLLDLECLTFPALSIRATSCLEYRLGLNCTTDFPGSSICKAQTVLVLGLYNGICQLL